MDRRDSPEKMHEMEHWLAEVNDELDLDPALIAEHKDSLLHLIGVIAHGPSRPGAPLSAFLIGYAAASGSDVEELVAAVEARANAWA